MVAITRILGCQGLDLWEGGRLEGEGSGGRLTNVAFLAICAQEKGVSNLSSVLLIPLLRLLRTHLGSLGVTWTDLFTAFPQGDKVTSAEKDF